MPAKEFNELVDVHGPHRAQMMRAFRLADPDLTDDELDTKYWPVLRAWIGDILGRYECPNCNGRGELNPGTGSDGWIVCPTCGGEGYGYDSKITGRALLVRDDQLPGPAPTGPIDDLVDWESTPWPTRPTKQRGR